MLQVGQDSQRPMEEVGFTAGVLWTLQPGSNPLNPQLPHRCLQLHMQVERSVPRWIGGRVARWVVGKRRLCETSRMHKPRCCYWELPWDLPTTTTPQTRQIGWLGSWSGTSARGGGCEAHVSRLVVMPGGLRPGAHRLPPPVESATVREPHEVPPWMMGCEAELGQNVVVEDRAASGQ